MDDYYEWLKYDSDDYDAPSRSYMYATRDTVDEAMSWIDRLDADTPWFATIALHTPHDPFQEPPDGFTPPSAGDPASVGYIFNLMAQNMDYHIGRLIGAVSPGVQAIENAQLENTLIIFIGDNGSHRDIAQEEAKTTIYEGGVRVPMIIADGLAVAQEMRGDPISPSFLDPSKLNVTTPRLAHVIDLYQTIVHIVDPAAALPIEEDSRSLISYLTNSGPQPPIRTYNFSQWFTRTQRRATIRNDDYKLNYNEVNDPDFYELYAYSGGEVPGLENGSAADIFATTLADVQAGVSNDAADNLNALLDELILSGNYATDDTGTQFPDPR